MRLSLKIVGQSGSGLLSTGEIMMAALRRAGYYVCADREYPSLIKGGVSCYQIDIADHPIFSLSDTQDFIIAVDRVGSMVYADQLREGGVFIYGDDRADQVPGFQDILRDRKYLVIHIPERETTHKLGGNDLFSNMLFLGVFWRVLGLDYAHVESEVTERFSSKPALLKIDLACLKFGYDFQEFSTSTSCIPSVGINRDGGAEKTLLLDGAKVVSLSAVHQGVRAYYAYPMSPSSGVLMHLADWAHETGMVIKQAEDEISVINMTLGSMYAGTRALCATSGGGFDLMVETISLAGMTEVPLVVINAQRPGPATGLPTWTAQADMNMAIHSGHGEFARMVVSLSDHESSFRLVGEAFNFAEKFQIPVIILTEKILMETVYNAASLPTDQTPIIRDITTDPAELKKLTSKDRYRFTESGVSARWLPGSDGPIFYCNGDEHREDGTLTEDGPEVKAMFDKRLRKMDSLKKAIPKPRIFENTKDKVQNTKGSIAFVGFGSTLLTMKDVIAEAAKQGIQVTYLHYDYVWPLDRESFLEFAKNNSNIHAIEGNATGQLASLLDPTDEIFKGKYLKYDGRRFYLEEVLGYIDEIKEQNL